MNALVLSENEVSFQLIFVHFLELLPSVVLSLTAKTMERSANYYQTSSFKKVMHSWLRVKIMSFAFSKNCGSSTFIIIAACLPAPRSHILNAEAKKSFIASSLITNLRSKDCNVRHIDECKETLLPHIISPSHIVAAEHHHTAS